jgi:hypothetical protein
MELELISQITAPVSRFGCVAKMNLVSGQGIKLKQTGPALDLLDVDVPANKKWEITVSITVIETDE